MRFGTWNVKSLYRSGSITTVVRELSRYKLDLMVVVEVRWDKGGTVRTGDYTLSVEKGMKIIYWGTGFFVHKTLAEFISDRMSYIVQRDRWSNIIALNVHAPTQENSDDSKDSFYEELEHTFDHFPK
jgi:exonuclease III